MKNNPLLVAALLGGGLLLLTAKGSAQNCSYPNRMVVLPTGKKVCETELPAMGYIKYNGIWYHQTQFPPSGQYAGTNANSLQWKNILVGLIDAGFNIYNMFTSGKDPGGAVNNP